MDFAQPPSPPTINIKVLPPNEQSSQPQTLDLIDSSLNYDSNITTNNNNNNNNSCEDKRKSFDNNIETPLWVSDPDKKRNDHLLFFQQSGNESFHCNLEEYKIIVFGRSTSVCNYVLTHPSISRKHALIGHDFEGRLQILDLNSLHGTYIDGKRIAASIPTTLHGGEKIHLGQDTGYFIVSQRNSYVQQTARSLSLKRVQIIQSMENAEQDEKLIQEYNDELLTFFSHLNKNYQLDKDIDGIRATIEQLSTFNQNTNFFKIQKYNGSSNSSNSSNSNNNNDKSILGKRTSRNSGRNISFNTNVDKLIYSCQNKEQHQQEEEIDTFIRIPINDLNPTQQSVSFQSSPIKQKKKYSTTIPKTYTLPLLFEHSQPSQTSQLFDDIELITTTTTTTTSTSSSPTKKFKSSSSSSLATTTTTTTTTSSLFSSSPPQLPQPFNQFNQKENSINNSSNCFNNNDNNNNNNNNIDRDDELPSSLDSTESESSNCNYNIEIVQISSPPPSLSPSDDFSSYHSQSPPITSSSTTAAC